MTVVTELRAEAPRRRRSVKLSPQALVLVSLAAFVVLSAVRTFTAGYDLTSSGTVTPR